MRPSPLPLLALLACAAAGARADDDFAARSLAATCANCHGEAGRSVDPAIPALAGRSATELQGLLRDFRSGQRPSTVMGQLTRGYSEDQLQRVAAWFAQQTPGARP